MNYVYRMKRRYCMEDSGRFPRVFVAIGAVVTATVVILALVFLYSSRYSYYPYCWGPGFMWGFMGFPMLMMFPIGIIMMIAVAYVVYRGFRWVGCCGGAPMDHGHYDGADGKKEPVMEILRRRYAEGEITKEQFEQRASVLNVMIELEKQGEVSSEEVKEEATKD